MVLNVCSSHTYKLDMPVRIYNIFLTKLLQPTMFNPLLGQVIREPQLLRIEVDGQVEYKVKEILD